MQPPQVMGLHAQKYSPQHICQNIHSPAAGPWCCIAKNHQLSLQSCRTL